MHLNSLKIKNFRILEDVEIEKLGHVNLIVGKNNSGKSTVLEAVALLAGGFEKNNVYQVARNRDSSIFVETDKALKTRVAYQNFLSNNYDGSDFFIGNNNNFLETELVHYFEKRNSFGIRQRNFISKEDFDEYSNKNMEVFTGIHVNLNNLSSPQLIKTDDDDNIIFLQSNKFSSLFNYEFVSTNLNQLKDIEILWDGVVLSNIEETVLEGLKLINPNIESIVFIKDDYYHRFSQNNNFDSRRVPYVKVQGNDLKVPLYSMGEGVIRLLSIFVHLAFCSDGILLIDEFENGLHYSIQPKVWHMIFDLAESLNIQVFATTHSWDCIESFAQVAKEREDLDGVLFRMGRSARKSDEGKVIATVYDEDELYNITKTKMEVR